MGTCLLGLTRSDALDPDAEPEPEDRELRQIIEPVGACKGQVVIASDRLRQTSFLEQTHESLDDRGFLRRFKGLAGKNIARVLVGDRQGVTVVS
jgi:hypothetical protein